MAITTAVAACLSAAALAPAYIGPGAGLGAIGSLLALVGAAALMVIGFVWYPVKRLLERRREDGFDGDSGEREPGADDAGSDAPSPASPTRDDP